VVDDDVVDVAVVERDRIVAVVGVATVARTEPQVPNDDVVGSDRHRAVVSSGLRVHAKCDPVTRSGLAGDGDVRLLDD
jgi:hypothetical protein